MSMQAAALVIKELEKKKDLSLCAATGNSPQGVYEALVSEHQKNKNLFRELRIVKLDEWCGLPANDSGTCEHYLCTRLLKPLGISSHRYLGFSSDAMNPETECQRIRSTLKRMGPIDLCVLGLGKNGHLGFNEPGRFVQPHGHVAKLTEQSRHHTMIQEVDTKPKYGMTLGLWNILSSKRIILLVSGSGKEETRNKLLSGKLTTQCPATFLWLHSNVDCLVNEGLD